MKKVAVIILNWNGSHWLSRFLPSVVENTPADLADVVVADNGSTDDSLHLLRTQFPTVKVIALGENHGFAQGYNLAIEATRYPYTLLLNSDAYPAPGWLPPLVAAMDADRQLAACQPKILAADAPASAPRFEYAGAAGGFIDRNGYPYCRGRIFGTVEPDHGQYDTPVECFWATGAALMVRTEAYMQVGGLDASFFAHMEEIDLCWRLQLAGYRVMAIPASTVYHVGGGSLNAADPRKTYLNFRNNLLMMHKNLPEADRRAALLRRRLLDALAWAKFVATLQWRNAAAIVRAHRDFSRMRANYRTSPERNLLTSPRRPNILTSYYLRGRRCFSQLL